MRNDCAILAVCFVSAAEQTSHAGAVAQQLKEIRRDTCAQSAEGNSVLLNLGGMKRISRNVGGGMAAMRPVRHRIEERALVVMDKASMECDRDDALRLIKRKPGKC